MTEDDNKVPLDRLRDRLGGLERLFERLDERMGSKLGKDDATKLMEFSSEKTDKLREDFVSRLSDFRMEVREAFKHAEKEYAAALYKSNAESEARIQTMINTALNDRKGGMHPAVYTGGGATVATALLIIASMMGLKFPGFN